MRRVGKAELFLVEGGVPHYREMVVLGREVARLVVREYGPEFFVERLADPYWLSCLSCVLGFEWNTSGQTTVTLTALKEALSKEPLGIAIVGGKGKMMRNIRQELEKALRKIGRLDVAGALERASTLSCKIDNNAVQDSYNVYFHTLVISENCSSAIINQGMNTDSRLARRYQWLSQEIGVEEPHTAIVAAGREEVVLDLTSRDARGCRACILDILRETPLRDLQSDLEKVKNILSRQATLDAEPQSPVYTVPPHLRPPQRFDEEVIRGAKQAVESFESLLLCEGVGASVVRGLAYISELVYGAAPSWRDPARFALAFGTKSGRPFPVERRAMLDAAETLRRVVESSDSEMLRGALRRLRGLINWLEA